MTSTISSSYFAPYQSSPLARTTSPLREPQTPPSPPRNTATLWDEYERHAVENAKRREMGSTCSPFQGPQRFSSGTVLDIIKSYDPHSSPKIPSIPASPALSSDLPNLVHQKSISGTTVALCKTCQQSITTVPGICKQCHWPGESTPPLNPACRNFASTDLPKLHKESASGSSTPTSSRSPKRRPKRFPEAQIADPLVRLASLKPPSVLELKDASYEGPRSWNSPLTDATERFLRLQISRKAAPPTHPQYHSSSTTTPPSTSQSRVSFPRTRPSSLANITTPQQFTSKNYNRHNSATPSESSALYPYISSCATMTSPTSVYRASYSLQNTTSAWDDWDSEEEEKAGLVGYWRGRIWRGSRGSLGTSSGRRESGAKEGEESKKEKKRRGFVRVISCGCREE